MTARSRGRRTVPAPFRGEPLRSLHNHVLASIERLVEQWCDGLDAGSLTQCDRVAGEANIALSHHAAHQRGPRTGTRVSNPLKYSPLRVAIFFCHDHGPRIDDDLRAFDGEQVELVEQPRLIDDSSCAYAKEWRHLASSKTAAGVARHRPPGSSLCGVSWVRHNVLTMAVCDAHLPAQSSYLFLRIRIDRRRRWLLASSRP